MYGVKCIFNLAYFGKLHPRFLEFPLNVVLHVVTNVALNLNDLAEKLEVSRKTIERDMTVLQEKGLVPRVGSNKTDH